MFLQGNQGIILCPDGWTIQLASPEKALPDWLCPNPFNNTGQEFEELRLDEDLIQQDLNRDLLEKYMLRFEHPIPGAAVFNRVFTSPYRAIYLPAIKNYRTHKTNLIVFLK